MPKYKVLIWWTEEHGFSVEVEALSEEEAAETVSKNLDHYLESIPSHHFLEVCWDNQGLDGYYIAEDQVEEVEEFAEL